MDGVRYSVAACRDVTSVVAGLTLDPSGPVHPVRGPVWGFLFAVSRRVKLRKLLGFLAILGLAVGLSGGMSPANPQVFTDVADLYGVADSGPGIGAAWLDYDDDGDLDILVSTNFFHTLFNNDGDRFADVAASVGLG